MADVCGAALGPLFSVAVAGTGPEDASVLEPLVAAPPPSRLAVAAASLLSSERLSLLHDAFRQHKQAPNQRERGSEDNQLMRSRTSNGHGLKKLAAGLSSRKRPQRLSW